MDNPIDIAEIAKATKRICDPKGYGHQVVVWPDGAWNEAVSDNDLTALLLDGGERVSPLARLRTPMTKAQVAAALGVARLSPGEGERVQFRTSRVVRLALLIRAEAEGLSEREAWERAATEWADRG